MWWPQINFRATAGFVKDKAGQTYCLGEAYPTVRNGYTFGFNSAIGNAKDRSASNPIELAGANEWASAGVWFQLDLPEPGMYEILMAMGDQGFQEVCSGTLADGTNAGKVVLETFTETVAVNNFMDARHNIVAAANWTGTGHYRRLYFGSNHLVITQVGSDYWLAHLAVRKVDQPRYLLPGSGLGS